MIKRLLIAITLVGALAVAVLFFTVSRFIQQPLSSQHHTATYFLAKGTSVKTMVRQMQHQRLLTKQQAMMLRWWIQSQGYAKLLKAGEYAFSADITPQALINKMIKGDVVQYMLTLSEGITFDEMLHHIHSHPAIKHTIDNKSPYEIMALLGEPFLAPEGVFFPSTYYFVLGTSDVELLARARKTMNARLTAVYAKRDPNSVLKTPYEALIMASIIEKEASTDAERPIISGVFQRRIQKNMLLQADPTVIYGLGSLLRGPLTGRDLKFDTPYNTYMYKGLPPTPIALPGLKAIEAACHPSAGDALYFMAKGDGTHQFSATLPEHYQAVAKYQKKDPKS